MKLTAFSRFLIVMLILAALFFGYRQCKPQLEEKFGNKVEPTENTTPAEGQVGGEQMNENKGGATTSSDPNASNVPLSNAASTFSYVPAEPINGKLKGVVELGASGFNSFIIRVDQQKNWKLEKAEFGSSLVYENMATDDDIRTGLKNYIRGMLDFGVPGKDIHFVVSSGAKSEPSVVKISNGLKALNYYVNEVTPQQEGTYGLNCIMPPSFEQNSFMVDIGSGNTKISWKTGSAIQALESHGAKYFQKSLSDQQVYDDVRKTVGKVSGNNRSTCFIMGGIPFELAKQSRNGKERYTVLKAPLDYKSTGEKQKAGLNIYKAIYDETSCKNFVFDWDANFTIGFLLGLK